VAPTVGVRVPPRLVRNGSAPRALQGGGAPLLWERAQDPWPPPRALQIRITAEAAHHGGSGDRGSERDRLDGEGAVGGVVLQFPISWIGDEVGGFRFS
jgi:hypothetical protein